MSDFMTQYLVEQFKSAIEEKHRLGMENARMSELLQEYDRWLNTIIQCDVDHEELKSRYELLHAQAEPFLAHEEV